MVTVLMVGGDNYTAPTEDDVEVFESIADAADEWRSRRDHGYWLRGSNGYLHPLWGDGLTDDDAVIACMDDGQCYTAHGVLVG